MSGRIAHVVGSGNVFADLGLPNPEERLAKAKLAHRITKLFEELGWDRSAAADALGIDRSEIAELLDGHLAEFSLDRLFQLLNRLNQDVEIVVRPNASSERRAGLSVAAD